MEDYRSRIRDTDKNILALVKRRLEVGTEVAKTKLERDLPMIDPDAEQVTIRNLTQFAAEIGVEERFAKRLGELLIEETVRVEQSTQPPQSKDEMMKIMFELTRKLTAQGRKVTRFEVGEPNFPPPKEVIRGLNSSFRGKRIVGYGPAAGLPELRKAVAAHLSKQHKTTIDPDQILITPGARFGIFATVTSFVSSLERVVIPQPAWPAYEECVNFIKGRPIPLKTTFENHWEIDLDLLESELKKGVRMLVLNSPCNPTGKVIAHEKFRRTLDLAEKYNTMILSDEVYDRYVHSPGPSILESDYDNFVYVNSFSKEFGLTGWRVAYLATTKENALRIRRVLQTAVTCVPEFIQNGALAALRKAKGEARRNVRAIMEKVEFTCRELRKIDVSFHKPEGSFYVFPRANKPNFDSLAFAKRLLEEHGISITPGQSFGEYPEFFRLAVSVPRTQISDAIKVIGAAIEAWP